jgi:hypothetical protein
VECQLLLPQVQLGCRMLQHRYHLSNVTLFKVVCKVMLVDTTGEEPCHGVGAC